MKILYFGTVCNAENYENMIADYNVKPSVASLVFENALMEGFKQVNAEIDIFSFPMIPAFPKCGKLFWGAEKETLSSGYKTTWIPTINITGLKQWSQGVKTRGIIKKWLKENQGEEKCVLIYSVYQPIAKNIIRYCKKSNTKCFAIIPDLPRNMYANSRINPVKKFLSRFYVKNALKLQCYFDGYVYLTEAMKDVINPSAPYVVVEGIASECPCLSVEKSEPPAVMYAGAMSDKYGVGNLIEAFLKLPEGNAQLWLFGYGDYSEKVVEYAEKYPQIKYFGRVERSEIIKYEQEATLLVNVRNVGDEFTAYSFPSKTIEYMNSGTPLLTTRLPGIPSDYYNYAYFIEDNSVDSIYVGMKNALDAGKQQLNSVGKSAKEFIEKEKNAEKQADKIYKFMLDFIYL